MKTYTLITLLLAAFVIYVVTQEHFNLAQSSTTRPQASMASSTVASVTTRTYASTPRLSWGVYTGSGEQDLQDFETLVGRQADIQAEFTGWSESFPSTFASSLCPNRTLLIFWENYNHSLDDIIAGKYDTYIESFSKDAAAYQCPVILSLFHEMNGNWDDWDGTEPGNSAEKIVAAWIHVHSLVTAPNVKWAWVVNNVSIPDVDGNHIADYYPGDQYVDYVGVDGFNMGNPWQSFGEVFDDAIATLQSYKKPIYIFSMGSIPGTRKATWIKDGLGSHIYTYQNVVGWVWFNAVDSKADWRVDTDRASLAAFKSVIP